MRFYERCDFPQHDQEGGARQIGPLLHGVLPNPAGTTTVKEFSGFEFVDDEVIPIRGPI